MKDPKRLNRLVREDNKALGETKTFVYDNNGNILNLPAFYNGNVVLYNSISGGILYVHDIKHLRFYENLFKTAVQLSAVNIDNIQITEDCEFFNAIYAKNCNFYVNIGQSVENSSSYFFNVASGTFINCNIYAYGNYYLPDVKKRFMKFQLINSHFSITLKNEENMYNYNISAKLSGFELSKSQISGNGLFNHTHRGPIPSSETIPFYDKTSVGSSYLLPCAYFPPPIPAKKQTPANIFNQRPNNMTTYSNIVYKNILELPVGAIMLSYYHKPCLYGTGTDLSVDNRIFTYYH